MAILIQGIFLVGMALIVAPVTVLVGDLERLVKILLRIFFYMTPIIYTAARIYDEVPGETPDQYLGLPTSSRPLYSLNPMAGIIDLYRAAVFPTCSSAGGLVAVSAGGQPGVLRGGLVGLRPAGVLDVEGALGGGAGDRCR